MNKKEIAEIRKQYTAQNCAVTRICGCYVNAEKEKIARFGQTFLTLPEEEMHKYFELLRKALSGTLGKTLHTLEFPLTRTDGPAASEASDPASADIPSDAPAPMLPQEFLLALRNSSLRDDALLDAWYDMVIRTFEYPENYLILIADAVYDIPHKGTDQLELEDASEEVYHFIHTCLCPVNLAKPALSYDPEEGCFHNRERDRVVSPPVLGLLFPAFHDRSSDIYSLLYYVRNQKEMHEEFTDAVLGCPCPRSAPDQKKIFTQIVEEALGEECSYENVRTLHDQLHELTQAQKESPDPVTLSQGEVKNLLSLSGGSEEQLKDFKETYEEVAGEGASFSAGNVSSETKYVVRTPDVEIRVSADRSDLVETMIIEGRPCLVIPITDEVRVNGIKVRI